VPANQILGSVSDNAWGVNGGGGVSVALGESGAELFAEVAITTRIRLRRRRRSCRSRPAFGSPVIDKGPLMRMLISALTMMASDITRTGELDNAFLDRPQEVMDAVQRLRKQAKDYGYLRSNAQIIVGGGPYIEILPASPNFVCVPFYDPLIVLRASATRFRDRRCHPLRLRRSHRSRVPALGLGQQRNSLEHPYGDPQQHAVGTSRREPADVRPSICSAALDGPASARAASRDHPDVA
jgi:hypothetical protein